MRQRAGQVVDIRIRLVIHQHDRLFGDLSSQIWEIGTLATTVTPPGAWVNEVAGFLVWFGAKESRRPRREALEGLPSGNPRDERPKPTARSSSGKILPLT